MEGQAQQQRRSNLLTRVMELVHEECVQTHPHTMYAHTRHARNESFRKIRNHQTSTQGKREREEPADDVTKRNETKQKGTTERQDGTQVAHTSLVAHACFLFHR